MLDHPQVQRLYICDGVNDASRANNVGIFGVQRRRDDSRLVLSGFEVRIGEADEDLAELPLLEKVGQKFHRVRSQAGRILVRPALVLLAKSLDLVLDELGDVRSNFETW